MRESVEKSEEVENPKENSDEVSYAHTINKFRAIASVLVGASIGLGAAYEYRKLSSDDSLSTQIEYLKKDVMDLGERSGEYVNGIQLESETGKYILHIGQLHGMGGISAKEQEKDFFYVPQKRIEHLILTLKEKYGITVYFKEGLNYFSGDFSSYDSVANNVLSTPRQIEEMGDSLFRAYEKLKHNKPPEMSMYNFEDWKYRIYLSAQNMFQYYSARPNAHSQEFAKKSKEIKEEILKENPDIEKDAFYRHGSAYWLAERGEIALFPAETAEGNVAPMNPELTDEQREYAMMRVRENVAVGIGMQYGVKTNTKYLPIIYGSGHDFSHAVQEYNKLQNEPSYRMGLIRIVPKLK